MKAASVAWKISLKGMFEDALGHHQAGRLSEAEQLYRRILSADARHADSLHLLGLIASQTGHVGDAVELIRRAIAIGNHPTYHSSLGNVFHFDGKHDEAVACYQRALDLNPNFAEACNNLGTVYQMQGKLDAAIACYERALILKPDYVEAHNGLGSALTSQGKSRQAAACFEQALALRPDYADALTNLGNTLKAEGKLDAAAALHERALFLKPDCYVACNNLGAIRELQGRFDEAVTLYERALAQVPDYAHAKWNQVLMQLLFGISPPACLVMNVAGTPKLS
jgi:protein O-GlcNAc transferase